MREVLDIRILSREDVVCLVDIRILKLEGGLVLILRRDVPRKLVRVWRKILRSEVPKLVQVWRKNRVLIPRRKLVRV